MSRSKAAAACPCGGKTYAECCGPIHTGQPAPTPERLMRSRYTAFALANETYLLATWHSSTRPASLNLAGDADGDQAAAPATKWIGLEVRQSCIQDAEHGTVEFVARYRIGGRAFRLHEHSRFIREDGRWFYLDGDQLA